MTFTVQQVRRLFKLMQQGHALATAAAIDHLVHHSVILALNLPRYRLEASKRQISTVQHPVD